VICSGSNQSRSWQTCLFESASAVFITEPDFNRVFLQGGAVTSTCGLDLQGTQHAEMHAVTDYASDGKLL
jgi:pyrimidine deaminase RibD-like protein